MSTKQDRIDELEEVLEYAVEGTLDNVVQWIQGVDALTSMAAAIYYYSVKIPEIEQYQQQQQQYWIKAMKDQRDTSLLPAALVSACLHHVYNFIDVYAYAYEYGRL